MLPAMHSCKRLGIINDLESRLPSRWIDCIFDKGWVATLLIAYTDPGESMCMPEIDLARLDKRGLSYLADQLAADFDMFQRPAKPD